MLDFEIGGHEDALDIAGYQLYPPVFNPERVSYYVTQIDPNAEGNLRLRVTASVFRFNGAETISESGNELLPFTLQITGLEGMPVHPPELSINVLKDAEGRLMIASFDTVQTSEVAADVKEKECNEWPLLCKWKGIVAERIDKMRKMGKGCHKRPHGHPNPMMMDDFHGKPPHRVRPGHFGRPHHGPHHQGHGGHRHHAHHRLHMFLRRALFTILIPIVIGIFAGTVTYLIGMAVGCLIAMSIAKFRGQGYQRIALEEDVEQVEVVVEDKKEEYAELPAYDAPPVYEEAEVEAEEKAEDETK